MPIDEEVLERFFMEAGKGDVLGFAFSRKPWTIGESVGNSWTPAECLRDSDEDDVEDYEHDGTCAYEFSVCSRDCEFDLESVVKCAQGDGIGPAFGQPYLALLIGDGENDGGEVGLWESHAICIENARVAYAWDLSNHAA